MEGRAAPYVRQRKDDAQAALREYKHLLNQQEGLQAREEELERFTLFQGAPGDALSDLAAHDAMRARLALERGRAEEELERARARGAQGSPDVSFEDVAELSVARIEELRGALKPKPPLGALLALGGLAGGWLWPYWPVSS